MEKLILNRHEERRIEGGHLWIFSNEVDNRQTPLKNFQPGEQILVASQRGKLLGSAYINPNALLCARLFSRAGERLDAVLLFKRFQQALALRERLFKEPYYRLVYGESDLLPGLVVDRFGPHLCVQINTTGMEMMKTEIVETLVKLLQPQSILMRNDSSIRQLEGLVEEIAVAHGNPPGEVELVENGIRMIAPLQDGQKTGWYYDQRNNRAMLKNYVKGKRVLDVFSYVGGFAVHACVFGAREIWAVDASRFALEMAEKNAGFHGGAHLFTGAEGDAFDILKALHEEKEIFDVIIVDPPAFIKRKKDHKPGLKAYHRINELAMRLLAPHGILLSASCSMHLQREQLLDALRRSGCSLTRDVQILEEGGQGPDHPVHPAITETSYLKAFLAHVC